MKNWLILVISLFLLAMPVMADYRLYDDQKILYDFNHTISTGQTGRDRMRLMDIDAVTWVYPATSEFRYVIFDNRNINSFFYVRRMNPYSYAIEISNSSVPHPYANFLSSPQLFVGTYKLLFATYENTFNVSLFTYDITDGNITWLGNITQPPYTNKYTQLSLSNAISPNDFTTTYVQHYLLAINSTGTPTATLFYDFIKNGIWTNESTSQALSFYQIDKAYIVARNGYCQILSSACIFSIVYIGKPGVSDTYGIWQREYKKGLFGFDYADSLLLGISQYSSNDIKVFPFADPYSLRNFIVMDRWSNGTLYCKNVYDINFTLFTSFCTSDYNTFSPTWFATSELISTVNNLTHNITTLEFLNLSMPNHDKFYITNLISKKYQNADDQIETLNINVTMQNTTDITQQYLTLSYPISTNGMNSPTNVTGTFKVETGIFKNKTGVNLTIKSINVNSTIEAWIGFPKDMKWTYTTNAIDPTFTTVGNEIGFYIVPVFYTDAVAYNTIYNSFEILYQDVDVSCICDPYEDNVCVNTTHRRQLRYCDPVGCDSTVTYTADISCLTPTVVPLGNVTGSEGGLITLTCTDALTQADCIIITGCEWVSGSCVVSDFGSFITKMFDFNVLSILLIIIISVAAGYYTKNGTIAIITALMLLMVFSAVNLIPAWIGFVLVVLGIAVVVFFGSKMIVGGN